MRVSVAAPSAISFFIEHGTSKKAAYVLYRPIGKHITVVPCETLAKLQKMVTCASGIPIQMVASHADVTALVERHNLSPEAIDKICSALEIKKRR